MPDGKPWQRSERHWIFKAHPWDKVKEIMASGDRLYVYQVGRRVIGLTPTLLKAFR